MNRRDLLTLLALTAGQGLPLTRALAADSGPDASLYTLPARAPGAITLLHITDTHGQLEPLWYREPEVHPGAGALRGHLPHLTGGALLAAVGVARGTRAAYALSSLDFPEAARRFGKVGGYAHLATLVRLLRDQRPGALLLDGGDSWQGSGLALWTEGQVMIDASRALAVDAMTGHWEFTLGATRVRTAVDRELAAGPAFLAHNVATADFGDPVFQPWKLFDAGGTSVAVIGQAYPYTPIAHPRWLMPDWTFGIQEARLQEHVAAVRKAGARVVVLLSHNGMDLDLKLASRVQGIDVILGGHTHDAVPLALPVQNSGGRPLVTNAGSHGKFVGVLDFLPVDGSFHYRLLPVFAHALPPDPAMAGLIAQAGAPHRAALDQVLGVTEGLLYRRGTFIGTFDELILQALLATQDAEIALSPGFRWGGVVLPGEAIRREDLLNQTAISYPATLLRTLTGAALKNLLEDIADNVFNPDPYYQQGGDMVRCAGLSYRCDPYAAFGQRISDLRHRGAPLAADRRYRVASWASLDPAARDHGGPAIWDVVETWLRAHPRVPVLRPGNPLAAGVA